MISARPAERGAIHMLVGMQKFSASLMKSLEAKSVRVSREMNDFCICAMAGMTHNVYAYAVADLGGFINEAQRNVKPDLLRNCPT